ncbi:hypothetical protein ACSVH5_04330 [Flavobacterium sp. RSSA_27]|uniref:hypothetical protein n=1 Tax=Flavobacterium sp. RSSA_27 TaxID=3447667 RepID=UPI003F33DF3D
MRHYNLIKKYDKAKRHYDAGNYSRAKSLFESIVFEISSSDTESMADLNLCNSAEEYLFEIEEKAFNEEKSPKNRTLFFIFSLLILAIVLYFILN